MRNCGHCHKCGSELKKCLDGEEYCPSCQVYLRYWSHGWPYRAWRGPAECPDIDARGFIVRHK